LPALTAIASDLALDGADEPMVHLAAMWEARRQGRAMPVRRDFDVMDLKLWLGKISLHELHDHGGVRCRLRGSLLPVVAGYVKTGLWMNDAVPSAVPALAIQHFGEAMMRGQPVAHCLDLASEGCKFHYRRLALPLAAANDLPPMIMTLTLFDPHQADYFWHRYTDAQTRATPAT
jgi:hypothetical protein